MISLRWKTSIAEGHLVALQSWKNMNKVERLDALGDWIYHLNDMLEEEKKTIYKETL